MIYVVGVTGGIGSGKTTVTNRFAEHGIDVIDADIISREVVAPGSATLKTIEKHFGSDVLLADGSLDRPKLRSRIFANPDQKTWLNELLHPLIRTRIKEALDSARSPYCLLVAPLLLENKLNYLVDRVLIVDVGPETQIERTMTRDANTREQVEAIIETQIDRDARLAAADDVIDNERNLAEVYHQVDRLHEKYLELATHSK